MDGWVVGLKPCGIIMATIEASDQQHNLVE